MRLINISNVRVNLKSQVSENSLLYKEMNDTTKKTGLFGEKIFIFISNDCQKIELKKLGFFARLLRWIGILYQDSVFSKEQLESIKTAFKDVFSTKGAPGGCTGEVERLRETLDQIEGTEEGLKRLEELIEEIKGKERNEKWDQLFKEARETYETLKLSLKVNSLVPEGIPSALLDVLLVARSKKDQITAAQNFLYNYLQLDVHPIVLVNISIVLKLLDIDVGAKDPTKLELGIPLPEDLTKSINEIVTPLTAKFEEMNQESTNLPEHLKLYTLLNEIDKELMNCRDAIQEAMPELTEKVRESLAGAGVARGLIDEYLGDEVRLATRIFEQTELMKSEHPFTILTRNVRNRMQNLQETMVETIRSDYKSKWNPGAGDCFFYSCSHVFSEKDWRKEISNELKDEKYRELIEARIANDDRVYCRDQEDYCKWIGRNGNWGSEPELMAFSNLTKRPVIVVQNEGSNPFKWSAGFNLFYPGEPLIFLNHNAFHYEAMIKKA